MYHSYYAKVLRYGGWVDDKTVSSLSSDPEVLADYFDDNDDPRGDILRRYLKQTSHPENEKLRPGKMFVIPTEGVSIPYVHIGRQTFDIYPYAIERGQKKPDGYAFIWDHNIPQLNPSKVLRSYFTPEETVQIANKFPDENREAILKNIYYHFPHLKPQPTE